MGRLSALLAIVLYASFLVGCASVSNKPSQIIIPKFAPYGSQSEQISLLTFIDGKVIQKGNCIYLRSKNLGPFNDYLLIWDSTKSITLDQSSVSKLKLESDHTRDKSRALKLGDMIKISGSAFAVSEIDRSFLERLRLQPYNSWEELEADCDVTHFKTVSQFTYI